METTVPDAAALGEVDAYAGSLLSFVGTMIQQAHPIVLGVMAILLIASLWSWAIAIDKWLTMGGVNRRASQFEDAYWSGQPMENLSDRISPKGPDALARVFMAGAKEWRSVRQLPHSGSPEANALVERARTQMGVATGRESQKLETGLSTLAIIASSTPFIGLFGTVIGIMNSFRDIAARGETNLAVVAPGIAEALFATGMGLAAAIPALIFYNKFSSDIGKFSERMELFAQEFAVRISQRVNDSGREA
ncbi:MAG: protein TolQ [Hyphomonadaceae bacterium]